MFNFIFGFTICYAILGTVAVSKISSESERRKIDAESSESDADYYRNQCVQQLEKLEKQSRIIQHYKAKLDQQG
jgi:hypothetical protein